MRFGQHSVAPCLLLFLPLVTSYYGLGVFSALVLVMAVLAVRQAAVINDLKTRGSHGKKLILQTYPMSHYVDKVRWSMDIAGIEYEEEGDIGILGILLFGRPVPGLKVPAYGSHLYNSADIMRYLYGIVCGQPGMEEAQKFLEPSEEALKWEAKFDQMGIDIRSFMYYHVLVASPDPDALTQKVWGIGFSTVPGWQRFVLRVAFPLLRMALISLLRISPEGAKKGLAKAKACFAETDAILQEKEKKGDKTYLLGTDEPTYVDVTFASLAALIACPDELSGPVCLGAPGSAEREANVPTPSDLSPEMQKEVERFRKTPSGRFVLRLYKEHRMLPRKNK